jgi:hypothetical protein
LFELMSRVVCSVSNKSEITITNCCSIREMWDVMVHVRITRTVQ